MIRYLKTTTNNNNFYHLENLLIIKNIHHQLNSIYLFWNKYLIKADHIITVLTCCVYQSIFMFLWCFFLNNVIYKYLFIFIIHLYINMLYLYIVKTAYLKSFCFIFYFIFIIYIFWSERARTPIVVIFFYTKYSIYTFIHYLSIIIFWSFNLHIFIYRNPISIASWPFEAFQIFKHWNKF